MRPFVTFVLALSVCTLAIDARADEADRCATQAEEAQHARLKGKLTVARDNFIACASDRCPHAVRTDCARWLSEVESELPTVVVRATDADGRDITDARVYIDGVKVKERVDGLPLPVDVGEHAFGVERSEGAAVKTRLLIRIGERGRIVNLKFAPTARPKEPADARPEERPGLAPFVVGGVGIVLGGVGAALWLTGRGEHDDLERTCAPDGLCATSDIDAARTKLIAGDVLFGAGLLALAGAAVWLVLQHR